MRYGAPAYEHDRPEHIRAMDYAACICDQDERSRHGVAYGCRHAETLFGLPPRVDSIEPAELLFASEGHGPWSSNARGGAYTRPPSVDELIRRVLEGYRLLDEIFSPQERVGSAPRSAGGQHGGANARE